MSDNVNSSANAKPTGELWQANELAQKELEYADSHNHLLQQDAQIAFPVNGKIDQEEIQKQIRILEEVMRGKLSTQVEIDPGKEKADVRFLDFAPDPPESQSNSKAKGTGSEVPAGQEPTRNGFENAKLDAPVPDEAATNKEEAKAEDSAACQEKLPEVAYLLNLPEAPKDWNEVEQIRARLRSGPIQAQTLQQESNQLQNGSPTSGVEQTPSSLEELEQAINQSERRSFNLPETVSQGELDTVRNRYSELSNGCETTQSSTVWNGISPKTSVVVIDGNEADAFPQPIGASPSPTPDP